MVLELLITLLAIVLVLIVLRSTQSLAQIDSVYSAVPVKTAVFFAIWLGYLAVLSYFDVLAGTGFQPGIPLFVILPLFVVLGVTLVRPATSALVDTLSINWLIYFQSFRIVVELVIWGAYKQGVVPVDATFEGFNFDIVVGLTAIPLAYYLNKGTKSRPLLLAWNIAGLLILVNTVRIFIGSIYYPQMFGEQDSMVSLSFFNLPYLLIPGIFMPLAVYVHALSIKQLIRRKQTL